MEEQMFFDGYYEGLYYTLAVDGTKYSVYEYTPVLREKCEVASEETIFKGKYDDDYVISVMNKLLDKADTMVEQARKTYKQLRLPLEEVM